MKKNYFLVMSTMLMLAIGMSNCSSDSDNSVDNQKEIELKNFSNSGCKGDTRSGSDNNEIVEYSVLHDGYLYVNHLNATFNCCPGTIGADILVEDNKIIIGEYESSGDCNCICPYDLSYEVGPLVEGKTYTIYIGYKGLESKVAEFTFHNSMSGTWGVGSTNPTFEYEENPTTIMGTWHLVKEFSYWGGIREYVGKSTMMTISYDNYLIVDHIEGEEKTFLYGGIYDYTLTTDDANPGNQVITIKASADFSDFFQGPDEFRDIEYKFTYSIQDGMLFFDGGVDRDGPGYYFKMVIVNNGYD